MKPTISALLSVFALVLAVPAAAHTPDASGPWDLTFNTRNGPMQASLTIEKAGGPAPSTASPQPQGEKEKVDVTGAWALTIETGGGSGSPSVTFKQDGEKLTGHYSSQVLGERDFTGTIKGNAINFTIEAELQGQAVKVTYSGTVEKDTMKGKVVLGEFGEGTFTGKRK
jgi:hypothetical protein